MGNPANNTTTPSHPQYRWMGEPKQRGTFAIISLCFSTLIICVWSTLHFNVPTRRYTVTRRVSLQVSWMFFALLAPEVLLYLAIHERIVTGVLLKKVLKFHPHLAKPGMFTRMYNWIRGRADRRYNPIEQTPQPHFGLIHAFYARMGGFAFYGSYDDDTPKSLFEISTNPRCTIEVPNYDTLIYIMEHFPHIITDITEEDILDRAASSSLSKALLVVQVAWFCTNCASRLFQRLPLSLLEVSTAAHALCTLLTYFVWWSKPLNVPSPTLLREKEAREVYALLKCSDNEYDKALEMAQKMAEGGSSMLTGPDGLEKIVLAASALQHLLPAPERPPHDAGFLRSNRMLIPGILGDGNSPSGGGALSLIALATSPILYGLVHSLVWGVQFPTPTEELLWRVSSLMVIFSGFVGVGLASLITWCQKRYRGTTSRVFGISIWYFMIPLAHVLASGFLIAESIRQLWFLDDATYQLLAWSNYWPHLS